MKYLIYCFLALLCPFLHTFAQPPEPLNIGDQVPDITFQTLNPSHPTIKLSDFKNKLIILDFWATWCGSCIEAFPKMEKLQKELKDSIQIIYVNSRSSGDTKNKIVAFLKKRYNTANDLPFAVEDTLADILFRHKTVPHYAWISKDLRLVALTRSKDVSAKNIRSIIQSATASVPLKKDFYQNELLQPVKPLLVSDITRYEIAVANKMEGYNSFTRNRSTGNIIRGLVMCNLTIKKMYENIYHFLNKNAAGNNSIVWEISDSLKHLTDTRLCYYDLILPESEADSLYVRALRGLNSFTGYFARMEKRNAPCFALVKLNEKMPDSLFVNSGEQATDLRQSKGEYHLKNAPINLLVDELNRSEQIKLPIVNKTCIAYPISIDLSVNPTDFAALRKALQAYELDLIETRQTIDLFVISNK